MPIVNARMYSVTAECKADWHRVLRAALQRADLDWEVVDFDAPAPLAQLWARDDLGAAMMCGLPFARRAPRPTLIAAPVPRPARYGGRPLYCTDVVVAAGSPHRTIEDTFGGIVGYTLADSMSGAVALRDFLAPLRKKRGARLYRGAVGNLINARGVIDALAAGRIDVGPLDSYSHDLLEHYDPALAAQVRTIASTAMRPIPPLVATAPIGADALARLRDALLGTSRASALAAAMARLQLAGFAVVDAADYDILAAIATDSAIPFEDL
ncbi:MAG TPA: PhnD/SsuA/transferrin family substrate-binding protein [Caldimonas sp.]|jgi:ABC-type phosphate/phosphonate transport system substrate-binding protein|nr:PhnD/SsuA/transferrin family substrate-binding protein [Caldimonas sp.]